MLANNWNTVAVELVLLGEFIQNAVMCAIQVHENKAANLLAFMLIHIENICSTN